MNFAQATHDIRRKIDLSKDKVTSWTPISISKHLGGKYFFSVWRYLKCPFFLKKKNSSLLESRQMLLQSTLLSKWLVWMVHWSGKDFFSAQDLNEFITEWSAPVILNATRQENIDLIWEVLHTADNVLSRLSLQYSLTGYRPPTILRYQLIITVWEDR